MRFIVSPLFPDKPLCRAEQKKIYGIARNEEAKILCEVDSYPPPLSFRWSFNNTAETFEVPQKKFRTGTRFLSTLMYKPITDMDYGTVMCWAKNSAGEQSEPCVFHVIAAGTTSFLYRSKHSRVIKS